jgi:hypothetical protein
MTNLLPNLEAFLSEMQKQTQVESVQEENEKGSVIIKLKQDAIIDNAIMEPFSKLVKDLARKLRLERYLSTKKQKIDQETQNRMAQEFLTNMPRRFVIGEPKVSDREIIVHFKPEIGFYHEWDEASHEARKVGAKLLINPSFGFSIPTTERIIPIGAYIIDVCALHANRLRKYLRKDISKTDVAVSINFLLESGWTEGELCDLGFSHTSLHRYRKYQGENKE